jgi:hypothetical protein
VHWLHISALNLLPNLFQVSFVLDAFFLHFKAGSNSVSQRPASSKRGRLEFELAFSIVCDTMSSHSPFAAVLPSDPHSADAA